jgi:ATP-dependent exoDNAse (exonuclease V) beta subunit
MKLSSEQKSASDGVLKAAEAGRQLDTPTGRVKGAKQAPAPGLAANEGARLGSMVHSLFELVDWEEPEGVKQLAEDEARARDLPVAASAEAAEMVRETLRSEIIQRVLRDGEYYKELPFTVSHDGILIQGKIDVLFGGGNSIYVLDFKTDRISESQIKVRLEHYRTQSRSYVQALRVSCGILPRDVLFHFITMSQTFRSSRNLERTT